MGRRSPFQKANGRSQSLVSLKRALPNPERDYEACYRALSRASVLAVEEMEAGAARTEAGEGQNWEGKKLTTAGCVNSRQMQRTSISSWTSLHDSERSEALFGGFA